MLSMQLCRMAEQLTTKRGRPSRGQTPSYTGPTDSDGPEADEDEMEEEVVGECCLKKADYRRRKRRRCAPRVRVRAA